LNLSYLPIWGQQLLLRDHGYALKMQKEAKGFPILSAQPLF
jgi:hypothetical protein